MKLIQFNMRHFTCPCLMSTISLLLYLSLSGCFLVSSQQPQQQLSSSKSPPDANSGGLAKNNASIQLPASLAETIVKPFIQKALNGAGGALQPATTAVKPVAAAQPTTALSPPPPPVSPSHSPRKAPQITSSDPLQSASANFGNEDPIIYLDYSSISDEILHKRTANFVYFNADFNSCRHCHKLYSMWKELAVDIRWWRKLIKLFAINCSEEDNVEVCRRAGVTQFPQIKYYWIMSTSLDQDGQRLRILGKSVHAMRHLIMDRVLDSYSEHNKLLAMRSKQQQQQQPGASAPGTSSVSGVGVGNPLTSLIGPLLGGGSGGGGSSSSGGLMSILSSFTGLNSASGAAKQQPASGATSSISPSTTANLMESLGNTPNIMQLISTLTDSSGPLSRRAVQPMPSNWPELEQIEVSDSQQLLGMLPLDSGKSIGALLIMETQEFLYTGLEVMLDLGPYSNTTYIARVRDERSQLSKNLTKRDDIQAPALIYITGIQEVRLIMTAPKYTNDEDLRRAFVKAFERRQIKYPVKRIWSVSGSNQVRPPDSQEDEEILNKVHQIYMNDLQNALRASLMEQVFRHPDLSDDQYNALVKYVYALINYFPFKNDESLKFIKRLHTWLQNQVSPMDISEYKKQFHDVEEVFPKRDWVACKSLSNTKSIPNNNRKSSSLFENPSQLGKVVANVTRLFRSQQQQASKLKSVFSIFTTPTSHTSSSKQTNSPLGGNSSTQPARTTNKPVGGPAAVASVPDLGGGEKKEESHIERIIKSLTSASLGTDSSILKLISTALAGGTNSADAANGGRSKFAREYPCGAWKLAHVLVVNEYIKDSPRKDVKHIVLHILHQYMMHFYACPTCGNRVSDLQGEFKLNLDDHLVEQGDSVMLLWKMHNRVSKRLESEYRPGSPPKLQFPSESLCPKCRAARAQNDLVLTPNWYDKQVLQFLVHHYRPQSVISGTGSPSDSSASSSATSSMARPPLSPPLLLLAIASLTTIVGTTTVPYVSSPSLLLLSASMLALSFVILQLKLTI